MTVCLLSRRGLQLDVGKKCEVFVYKYSLENLSSCNLLLKSLRTWTAYNRGAEMKSVPNRAHSCLT